MGSILKRQASMLVVALLGMCLWLPSPAFGLSASLEVRAKAESAAPAYSSMGLAVVDTGTVDPGGDDPDPIPVDLAIGDRLRVELTGPTDSDFDLSLLWPGASAADDFYVAAAAVTTGYPEVMMFDAAWPGTYAITVNVFSGSGEYTLDWTVEDASSSGDMQRMQGDDRYLTSVDVANKIWGDIPSRDIVLASGSSFADSLTASGLAGTLGCPLLLVPASSAPSYVVSELERIGVTDVHIVGGPSAISNAVYESLSSDGYDVYRYGGRDRYETSAIVAYAVDALSTSTPDYVFLARGDLFADALVVSPLAYARSYPILLTRSDSLSSDAQAAIQTLSVQDVIIAGSYTAVSANVEQQLDALVGADHVARKGGSDRYQTAVLIAEMGIERYWATPEWTGVASGTNFPDAVCGGAGIGAQGGVMVLTDPNRLTSRTSSFIASATQDGLLDDAVIFGGPAAVSTGVESQIAEVIDQWRD